LIENPGEFAINAMLCDSVSTAEGKLFVHGGGWSSLGTPKFPFVQPRIGLAILLSVPYSGTNKAIMLEIKLENEDGEVVPLGPPQRIPDGSEERRPMGVGVQLTVPRMTAMPLGESQVVPLAVNLDQLVFQSPGYYRFALSINGLLVERVPFRVLVPQQTIVRRG